MSEAYRRHATSALLMLILPSFHYDDADFDYFADANTDIDAFDDMRHHSIRAYAAD